MPPNTVKVDRTTKWGNPFVIGVDGTQEECIAQYRKLMDGTLPKTAMTSARSAYRRMVLEGIGELRGLDLACWCKPGSPCHADVLLELANPVEP